MAINLLHMHVHALPHAGYCTWMAVSIVGWTCSALCKELGITAAAVCLAWDAFIIQKVSLRL